MAVADAGFSALGCATQEAATFLSRLRDGNPNLECLFLMFQSARRPRIAIKEKLLTPGLFLKMVTVLTNKVLVVITACYEISAPT